MKSMTQEELDIIDKFTSIIESINTKSYVENDKNKTTIIFTTTSGGLGRVDFATNINKITNIK